MKAVRPRQLRHFATGRGPPAAVVRNSNREVRSSPKEFMEFLKSLATQKNWRTSLEVLHSMRTKTIAPDVWAYNAVLHCCAQAEAPTVATDVLADMISRGVRPDVVSYNSCMTAQERGGKPERALELFEELPNYGLTPQAITYNVAIAACGKLNHWQRALELLDAMNADPALAPTPVTYTTALNAMNDWQRALSLFNSFPPSARSAQIQHSLMSILSRNAQFARCTALLDASGPSTRNYNAILRGSTWEQALELLTTHMVESRCTPDMVSYNSALRALRDGGQWQRALNMFDTIRRDRSSSSTSSNSTSSSSSSHSGMLHPTVVTYNEVLLALDRANKPALTRRVLQQMWQDGRCVPNVVSYQCAIVASGRQTNGGWQMALGVFEEMNRRRCDPDQRVYTSLLRILGEGGQWKQALEMLETAKMSIQPTTTVYNACISALRDASQTDAVRLVKEMRDTGIRPDVITYTAAIGACSEWQTALKLFNEIRKEGIKPTIKTASAIVSALARDQPGIALRIFKKIPAHDRDVTLINTALRALDALGAWSHAVELVTQHAAQSDGASYRTCIDICERHEQFVTSEELYARMVAQELTPTKGDLRGPKLDLHGYTKGMACAAVRKYLRTQRPVRDLILVTGEGKHSTGERGPVLEEALVTMGHIMRPIVHFEKGSFVLAGDDLDVVPTREPIAGRLKLSKDMWMQWLDGGQQIIVDATN